jgi:hypothetical protein
MLAPSALLAESADKRAAYEAIRDSKLSKAKWEVFAGEDFRVAYHNRHLKFSDLERLPDAKVPEFKSLTYRQLEAYGAGQLVSALSESLDVETLAPKGLQRQVADNGATVKANVAKLVKVLNKSATASTEWINLLPKESKDRAPASNATLVRVEEGVLNSIHPTTRKPSGSRER